MAIVTFPRVGRVIQKVETKFHQAALAKATTKSGMLIVYPRVDDRYADASAKVTFLAKLVNPNHEMRIVISFMACSGTASDAVVGTAADGRAMGNSRDFSPWLMELPNRRYLLHYRP